jgi:hypothetical protein
MKLISIITAILLLFVPLVRAKQLEPADVSGKWYRVVPGCSLYLDFSADGTCKVERAYTDGREDHSIVATTKWHFDGWCIVVEPEESKEVEKALDEPIRLSMIETNRGERVLGYRLHWDRMKEKLSADVFHRGERPKFNPPSVPDVPSGKQSAIGPNQALQHNDPSCHVSCLRTPRASRSRG